MTRALTAVLLIALAVSPAVADERADKHRTKRILGVTGVLAGFAMSEIYFKDALTPNTCRWCAPPSIDVSARNGLVWSDREAARDLSNMVGYVIVPLGTAGLLMIASAGVDAEDRWMTYVDDLIVVFEAASYSQIFVQSAKFSFGRQRPYAHFAADPLPHEADQNLSFFSGHSTLTFSIAVSAGAVASARGYKLAPAIWATGLTLAASTAYLRVAADRHYFTDVLTGSLFGVAAGLVIPRLTGSLPSVGITDIKVVPTGNGASVVGTF